MPSKTIEPAVGLTSRTSALAMVDLPQPGLADDGQAPAARHRERHVVDGAEGLAAAAVLDDEARDVEQRGAVVGVVVASGSCWRAHGRGPPLVAGMPAGARGARSRAGGLGDRVAVLGVVGSSGSSHSPSSGIAASRARV